MKKYAMLQFRRTLLGIRYKAEKQFMPKKPHHFSLENIDQILGDYSRRLFSGLKDEEYNILKWLAKNGAQSLSEINEFRRWSVKRHLYGSKRIFSLIDQEYVRIIVINKRKKYDLTMKGLLAVLAVTHFEDIHLIQTYRKSLQRKIKKIKLVKWSLDFIKYEIALVMNYNYLQGLDWTRFKFVQWYWDNLKDEDTIISEIIVNPIFLKKNNVATEDYNYIKKEYLRLFFILNFCTIKISLGKQVNPNILEKDQTGRKFIHLWHHYLIWDTSEKSLKERQQYRTIKKNAEKPYREYLESIEKEAKEIVLKNGYEISNKT
ncbi:protein of unknown function [Nitrosotalea devaniterrae]|uniref:Uncharacterized protein n=1 Tax=Nitrosotalea devaniterrae TaxID=1078905 RepID=A0A128A666_9ARCH|nr:protein of unknown function [Candidatus Nitrosotalea devanaterra]